MNFYDNIENVKSYITMSKDYQTDLLVDTLRKLLPDGSKVLELGMGPGLDFEKLSQYFETTGSDNSQVFLDLYRKKNPQAKLLKVDAKAICLQENYDGIYSNKVLVHLNEDELKHSIRLQYDVVSDGGIVIHSFWRGQGSSHEGGVDHYYYQDDQLVQCFSQYFDVLMVEGYGEMEDHDSVLIVAKKKERGMES